MNENKIFVFSKRMKSVLHENNYTSDFRMCSSPLVDFAMCMYLDVIVGAYAWNEILHSSFSTLKMSKFAVHFIKVVY